MHTFLLQIWKYRSSTKEGVHKPVYAGFVGVDVEKDRRISLRTLVRFSVAAAENLSSFFS